MERVHRAVIAYASVGSGHRMAAEAVCARLVRRGVTCETVDLLEHGRLRVSGDLLALSFTGPTAPLYDRAWHSDATAGTGVPGSSTLLAAAYGPFRLALLEREPDVLVCTHAMPTILAQRWRGKGILDAKIAAVLTDFQAHSQWPLGIDAYCVPSQRAADTLVRHGTHDESVFVTGIPLRARFDSPTADTAEHDPDAGPVLFVTGAVKQRGYHKLSASLPHVLHGLADAHVPATVVAGMNEQLRASLAPLAGPDVRVLGFVEEMQPLMHDARMLVGKPGGLVCAEALACALPIVLLGPAWGQERANAEALVETGVAVWADDFADGPHVVTELAQDPARLATMSRASRDLHRPSATDAVADVVLGLL